MKAKKIRRYLKKRDIDPNERSYISRTVTKDIVVLDDNFEFHTIKVERVQRLLSPKCGRSLYKHMKQGM